ncbi:trypsin-like serine peptidase [Ruegeria meonggei]|uniref:Glutamyl endopeptidase n=1 Tax=Ruegeria meonggei TaxID=1446476 RepID=A0A1X6ZUT9_9RHOB|nr:trypsin-like serine protease [Ruegeria meonggei]SLN62068.1 Glutamyl endopeptidase precursor [Ruegeria meonggei]
MRNWIRALALALTPMAAMAQDSGLKSLDTTDAGRAWMAVGRLNINGSGFCTGTLVSPTLVLTAAHCLYDKVTGQHIDLSQVEFLAAWRLGRASAYRAARQAVIHPDYQYDTKTPNAGLRNDIALIELWQPIRNTAIIPFETGTRPRRGEEVGVVSYAHDRAEAPALQEVCSVITRRTEVLVMSCDVELGSSGAPVFSFDGDRPRIVSVVAAKAEYKGQRVSVGTAVEGSLELLEAELLAGRGFSAAAPPGGTSRNIGARFIKP